ncbi:MAG: yocK [Verrucomicrobiales bacterium]|nr:yocK [Verrucomicrobiales bacterium]
MKTEPILTTSRPKDNTSQILGNLNGHKINPKWRGAYDNLMDLRDVLLHAKSDLQQAAKSDQHGAFSMHMADAASDQYDLDFALGMMSSEQNSLYEIEQALNRIRNGSYGLCEMSGEPIEAERLEAIPWTRYSAVAQRELELQTGFGGPKLGKLASLAAPISEDDDDDSDTD